MSIAPALPAELRVRLAEPALCGLRGRFHSHITVRATAAALGAFCAERPGLKATVIDLADFAGRAQQDRMVTAYHFSPGGAEGMAHIGAQLDQTVAALQAAGLEVLRVKLEHEALPTLEPFSPTRYREVHVKLRLDTADHAAVMDRLRQHAARFGYVPSRSPAQHLDGGRSLHQFLNLRLYAGTLADTQAQVAALHAFLTDDCGLEVVEIKQETAILDTAHDLDRWWA